MSWLDSPTLRLTEARKAQVARDREYLHEHPELSMQEFETAKYIRGRLEEMGVRVVKIGSTGLAGIIENGDGAVVAHRADMDALPVREETGLPFASKARGMLFGESVPVMHACGHDIHMAVALGAAAQLQENRERWSGTVIFIFQPAEETAEGAAMMVSEGLWEVLPKPEVILGMHVYPFEAGTAQVPAGVAMSMADSLRITVQGRGAHGAEPEKSIDPIVLTASMILRLQTIVSRELNPRDFAVLTVASIRAGLKENVIPDSAEFTINMRTFDRSVRQHMLDSIRRIIDAESMASGAPRPIISPITSFPECRNDPVQADRTLSDLRRALGESSVTSCEPRSASEDFGELGRSHGIPTVFWFLGGTEEVDHADDRAAVANHSPKFAPFSEPTLSRGVVAVTATLMSRLATA